MVFLIWKQKQFLPNDLRYLQHVWGAHFTPKEVEIFQRMSGASHVLHVLLPALRITFVVFVGIQEK